MKKSFFGLMAFAAVCAFVLTGCYEKSPNEKTPSEYYVLGTVYDAETGNAITDDITVIVEGKSVGNVFKLKLSGYVPTVTVSASAVGYVPASRTIPIEKLNDYNQVSYTNVDLALIKESPVTPGPGEPEQPEPVVVVVGAPVQGAEGLDKEAVKGLFGIGFGDVALGDKGLVEVFVHYGFIDNELNVGSDLHMNQVIGSTTAPYTVKDSVYVGYIWNYDKPDYVKELKSAFLKLFNTSNTGNKFSDFTKNSVPFSAVLNKDGSMNLVGYCVCKDFTLWTVPCSIEGVDFNIMALQSIGTHVTPIVGDNHDNHDNHDNKGDSHDNHHNNHNNHGQATAYGGGVGDAE